LTRLISTTTLFTFGGSCGRTGLITTRVETCLRTARESFPGGSSATLNQQRKLTNAGLRSDVSYVKGKHNLKAGATFSAYVLTENFNFGITIQIFFRRRLIPRAIPASYLVVRPLRSRRARTYILST